MTPEAFMFDSAILLRFIYYPSLPPQACKDQAYISEVQHWIIQETEAWIE